jgi:hypothetical protein
VGGRDTLFQEGVSLGKKVTLLSSVFWFVELPRPAQHHPVYPLDVGLGFARLVAIVLAILRAWSRLCGRRIHLRPTARRSHERPNFLLTTGAFSSRKLDFAKRLIRSVLIWRWHAEASTLSPVNAAGISK